jgi:hypothetical protein
MEAFGKDFKRDGKGSVMSNYSKKKDNNCLYANILLIFISLNNSERLVF